MSDVFTKQRPMIDWDEFERRLRRPCSTDQMDDDPLAELLRIIAGNDERHETHFEPKNPLSAGARTDAGEPGELNQPEAQVRLVGGDFAAIEAGLLGTKQPQAASLPDAVKPTIEDRSPNARAPLVGGDFAAIEAGLLDAAREQAAATVSEANTSNAISSMDIESQRFLPQDNQPASRHAGVADGQNRSRRPLYGMVAIVIVAMAGIAVSFGLKSRLSGLPESASFKGESEAAKQQTGATSSANAPVLDTAILSKPPEPPPTALDNGTKQPIDLPQVAEKTLPAESQTQTDNKPPNVPSALAQTPAEPLSMTAPIESAPAQMPAEPLSMAAPIEAAPAQMPAEPPRMAAPIESENMKSDVVRPDGTFPPNAQPPQANLNEAPLPAPQSPTVAKAPRAKAVGRVAKPLKPTAARHPGPHGSPRQIANKAKAMPLSPSNAEPAPVADPNAVTPTTHPSPETDGAFGFVQSAVNSLASATAKLLELGRNVTGSRP
jgi:hypothetical protein